MLEARGGIEPPIKVLQTFALPLGDRAHTRSRLRVFLERFHILRCYEDCLIPPELELLELLMGDLRVEAAATRYHDSFSAS